MDNGANSYRRFLDGDNGGFTELVKEYKDGLMMYINSFVNNIYTAEELCEDTFVKLGFKKPKYNGKASFKTWLYAIGRNVAIDYLRKNAKHREISTEDCILSDEADIEKSYIQSEEKIALHTAMRKLKAEYRQALWLVYFEGFSNKEAAVIMKKSVHGVETLLYRARLALKAELGEAD